MIECILRFIACPKRSLFFRDYNNILDLIAVLPMFFHAAQLAAADHSLGNMDDVLLSVVPGLRVLKTLRKFEKFQLLLEAMELAIEGLPVCLFTMLVLTLTFSALIFLAEPRDNIPSLQTAMWLCINLQTMVGYPNIVPTSAMGSLVVVALIIVSVLYLAMPLGIIGNAFAEVWQQRQLRILCHRTRARMTLWGYGPEDVEALFQLFDKAGQGELNQADFVAMVAAMGLGMKEHLSVALFGSLDVDGSGAIDDREFVAAVFPHQYDRIYEQQELTQSSPRAEDQGGGARGAGDGGDASKQAAQDAGGA